MVLALTWSGWSGLMATVGVILAVWARHAWRAAVREELHTELERMLNDIIKFKIHIQTGLEAYEDFVAAEVERECHEQEVAEGAAMEEQAEFEGQVDEMEE